MRRICRLRQWRRGRIDLAMSEWLVRAFSASGHDPKLMVSATVLPFYRELCLCGILCHASYRYTHRHIRLSGGYALCDLLRGKCWYILPTDSTLRPLVDVASSHTQV